MNPRIELDSIVVHRSKSEYRPVNRASCMGLESSGDGDNLKKIAQLMLEAGVGGEVDVYRDKTPVFLSVPLSDLANASLGRGEQPEQLKKKNTKKERSDG